MNEIPQQSPNRVSLTQIIELGVQKTYHDLSVLAELLPRKTDFERKVEIVKFAERTRQLFIRLLALVKWAGGASKIEQCMDIVSFLDKQALLFINTADNMVNISRTTLVQARLPPFQLPCSVEVLTLGTYSRIPTCVRDMIVPPDPITLDDKRSTLERLDHIIEQRLSTSEIHPSMRDLRVELGRVIFHVENEFDLKLTLLGDSPSLPWTVLGLDLLVEDADTGEGKDLVHPMNIRMMEQLVQQKLNSSPNPLVDVFAKLHNFCLSLQIEVLHDQIERLIRERLSNFIRIEEHIPGQELAISYWAGKNVLRIQVDQQDQTRPLKLTHNPELMVECAEIEHPRENIFKPGNVSIEQLISDTILKRAVIKLNHLANDLRDKKYGTCTITGAPSLLHVCCLDPCASSEELIISIDLNGSYLAHVPQYERNCPLADNIQKSLNSNKSKLGTYFDQLKIWLMKKRCLNTIDYLSVTASETLPLCAKANHQRLDDEVPRLFIQFNKYNHYFLMAEFFTTDKNPFSVDTQYSLIVTDSAPSLSGDALDTDTSIDSVRRDLLVLENRLRLDITKLIASNYCYDLSSRDKTHTFVNNLGQQLITKFGTDSIKGFGFPAEMNSPVVLVSELPQLVSYCEEKLAHLALEKELRVRSFDYELGNSEASGLAYCVSLNKLPSFKSNGYSSALKRDLFVMSICLHEKPQSSKIWHCSYIFRNCPITTQSPREQSSKRFVFTPYESPLQNSMMVSKFIDDTHLDWACMAHLYDVVKQFALDIQNEPKILKSIILKSFNYKKLVIIYGPRRDLSVTIFWKPLERRFHLMFGFIGSSPSGFNPHSCMSTHHKHEFNQDKSIKRLVKRLNSSVVPLAALQNLPVYPFLGSIHARPFLPVASFCLIPQSTNRVKLFYRKCSAIDIRIEDCGNVIVRDGAYSKFDRNNTVEDLSPIHCFNRLLNHNKQAVNICVDAEEFVQRFTVENLDRHLGLSFMMRNIYTTIYASQPKSSGSNSTPTNCGNETEIEFTSEFLHYRFTLDPSANSIRLQATPLKPEIWPRDDVECLQHYFESKIGCWPFKADPFCGYFKIISNLSKSFPVDTLRDFIRLFRMELCAGQLEPSVHWSVALCPLVPCATPYMNKSIGMSSVCPLQKVSIFVVQLTRRTNTSQSIILPLSFELATNTLSVFMPKALAKTANLPHLEAIDRQLRHINEQFKANAGLGCIIFHAIRQLVINPSLVGRL